MRKILQGQIVSSDGVQKQQVEFDDETGLITKVGNLGETQIDYDYSDDCLVFSGMGDIHIHAREDVSGKHLYKEDFISASKAALNGGVTQICDMPNNPIAPIDDESYKDKWELTHKACCSLFLYAGIGPDTKPLSYKVPYKAYMGPSVGDLFFKTNNELEEVIKYYKGEWVSFHCEDPVLLEQSKNEKTHLKRRPLAAELLATDFALELIEKYSLQGKLCHYSAGEGLEKIKAAKARGVPVTCEVTPQHLYFSENNIPEENKILFQMNPPIREEEDRLKMLDGLKAGHIDYLATDHAPHSPDEKEKGTSGMTGLDTFAPFVTWLIKDQDVKPEIIAKVCSENPGKFLNEFTETWKTLGIKHKFDQGFGLIEKGYFANFTVLNMQKPICIQKDQLQTKAQWSPFEGIEFPGSIEEIIQFGVVSRQHQATVSNN